MTTLSHLAAHPAAVRPFTARPYFERSGSGFEPTTESLSIWGPNTLSGPPILGLLTHTIEVEYAEDDFFVARLSADLFRSVKKELLTTRSRLIRRGNRIRVAEAEVLQAGEVVARATAVSYRKTGNARGQRWSTARVPQPPPPRAPSSKRLIGTSGDGRPWQTLPDTSPIWQSAERKRLWASGWSLIAGVDTTPFTRVAMISDLTNLVTSMGTEGVGYINGDVVLALTRLPRGTELGLEADGHWEAEGVAVGSATLFDREGDFGMCTVSCLANEPRS